MPMGPELRRRRILLTLFFAVMLAYQGRYAAECVNALLRREPAAMLPFELDRWRPVVSEVKEEGAAAGLREGDLLLSLLGEACRGRAQVARAVRGLPAGATLGLEVERDGARLPLKVVLPPRPARGGPAAELLTVAFVGVFTPFVCLLLGFAVAALRPGDARAWLVLLMMASFSQLASVDQGHPLGWEAPARLFAVPWQGLIGQCWSIGFLLFGILFRSVCRSTGAGRG